MPGACSVWFASLRLQISSAVKAGPVYFASVFAIGFALGTVRVLMLAPRVGTLRAMILETPVILTASWILCGWTVRRFAVPAFAGHRLAMGGVAFVLLISAEVLLSLAIGRGPAAYFASFGTAEGALGLAGQAVFALFPWIRTWTSGS
jgi:hypothetical protein